MDPNDSDEANEAYKDYQRRLEKKNDANNPKKNSPRKKVSESKKQATIVLPSKPDIDYGGLMHQLTMMTNPQAAIDARLAQVKKEIKDHLKNEKWGNDHLSTFQRDVLGPFLQKQMKNAQNKVDLGKE